MSANQDRVAELIRQFGETGADVLMAHGLTGAEAVELGLKIAQRVCAQFAGENLYIPVGYAQQLSERDADIYRSMEAKQPVSAIAQRHGITMKQVYERYRLYAAAQVARNQGNLFKE